MNYQLTIPIPPPPEVQAALNALRKKDESVFGTGSLAILKEWRRQQFKVKHECLMKRQMVYWLPLPEQLTKGIKNGTENA